MPGSAVARVLVVSAAESARQAAAEVLRRAGGFIVRETGSFGPALALARDGAVDALVLDGDLPDACGLDGCRMFEREHPDVIVLHISADYATSADRVRGLESGADACLAAPVEPAELVATLKAHLRVRIAEAARRESEARFRALVEAVPQFVWTCDAEGRCTYLSPQWFVYTGRTPEQQLGFGWLDVVHPDDRVALLVAWRRAVTTGRPLDTEVRVLDAAGGYRWFKKRAILSASRSDGTTYWLGTSTDITNVVEDKTALQRNEERLALALRVGELGTWDWDLIADRRVWSEKVFHILGYDEPTPDPIPLSRWRDRVHPDDLRAVLARLDEAKRTRTRYRTQYRIRRADDGRVVWIDSEGMFFYDEAGVATRMVGVLRDVTENRRAQDALRENEARLRGFIDAAPVAIAMFDREMRYLAASGRYVVDYRLDDRALIGRSHYELFPESPERWKRIHRRCLQGAVERSDAERFVRQDGSDSWVRWEIQPWFESGRSIGGIVLFSEDVTRRKRAEDALFREKERAQVTLHSIGDAVITTDRGGIVDYLNPVAEALTGWGRDEALGQPLRAVFDVIGEHDRRPTPDPVERCLATGAVVGLGNHTILVSRDGAERPIADSAAPIRDRDGSLLGVVLVFHDVGETRQLARQLAFDASHDALTGLVNRREFEHRLERAAASAKHHGHEHALCYLDLDQFKLINDTAGHAAGDALLKQVRGVLAGNVRERDTVARLGGDEFALLLEHCSLNEASGISERVVGAFREWRFPWNGRSYQVGVSAGLVAVTDRSEGAQQILAEADVACYTAKEHGRSRVHVYRRDGGLPSPQHVQILLASRLREALSEGRFRLFAQPVVSLAQPGACLLYHEVLLRMVDGEEGLILPGTFIPAAERYGLMASIDRWVIEHSLRIYAGTARADERAPLALNLSGDSLNTDDFADFVLDQFDARQVRPENVCFEITETAAIQNVDQARNFIAEIRRRGCRFALDDFGSGLSSFRYLRELRPDYLKVDGSFVERMSRDSHDAAVVAAINEVGHALGILTVAEYAHDDATVACLRGLDVDYAQGYAFGAPGPLEEWLELGAPEGPELGRPRPGGPGPGGPGLADPGLRDPKAGLAADA